MLTQKSLEQRIKIRARALGFDVVGITPAEPGIHLPFFLDWLQANYHAGQSYLARPDRLARRQDLAVILPGVKSLVVVGWHYWPGPSPAAVDDPARGRISCYAQNLDYHQQMLPRLASLHAFIEAEVGQPVPGRAYVDTGPLLERDHALQAGLGFIGKNCNLIRPRQGSWLFIGLLMLDLALTPDQANRMPDCGRCTRCQSACPTGAFVEPYTLDSRRCISYLTTAHKGSIPPELRPLLGNHIFGCDICQLVCPWNRFATPRPGHQLTPVAPSLLSLIELTEDAFQNRFGSTPIGHIKRDRFLRNVAVAIGNWASPEAIPSLASAIQEPSSLVREHVAWALGRIVTPQSTRVLASALDREADPAVNAEIRQALANHEHGSPLADK